MPDRPFLVWLLLLCAFLLAALSACAIAEPARTPVPEIVASEPTLMATLRPVPTLPPTPPTTPTASPLPSYTANPSPTPRPTLPLPSDTPTALSTTTATPTLEDTPTPTDVPATATPTATPTAMPTVTPTVALPTATRKPQPPVPTATPEDDYRFDITMQRMFHIDENGGDVGNHNIYVHAFDASGNPLNGVVVCRVYALQLQPPDPHACRITGETGPGRLHFDVYAGDIVYVATKDPEHRPLSPHTRSLEQEPAAMTDLQELVDNGYCADVEDCKRRIPINNLVRFHYSYEVHFRQR